MRARLAMVLGAGLALAGAAVWAGVAGDVDGDGIPDSGMENAKWGDPEALATVNFEKGSAALSGEARAILASVARDLLKSGDAIEIGGHTDSSGEDAYNKELSAQRARAVRQYLINRGVPAERLSAVGYGYTQPVDSNKTWEGRQHNRRADLKAAPVAQN